MMNEKLYSLIKNKVSSNHLKNILGDSLYRGFVNYQSYAGEKTIDFAELLLKALGNDVIYNKDFQSFIVYKSLSDHLINLLANKLNITGDSIFFKREEVLKKTQRKIGDSLIQILELDPDEFNLSGLSLNKEIDDIFVTPDQTKYLSLHKYQKSIKDEITKNLLEDPKSRMLVHMPTGSGKTKTCIEAIIDFLRTRPFDEGIVIWFAHSNELCQQAYHTLVNTWKFKGDFPLPVFRVFGDHDAIDEILSVKKGVLFIGFQKFLSIQKSKKSNLVKIRTHLSTHSELIVIDEAHKSLATTYKSTIEYVSQMPNCRLIGLTATPGRSGNMYDPSNSILSDLFNNKLISIRNDEGEMIQNPLKYLQEIDVLARIDHKPIEVSYSDFSDEEFKKIALSKGVNDFEIQKIDENPLRNKIIIDEIEKALLDESKNLVLVFANSINHCILLQKFLEFQNIESQIVLSNTPNNLRDKYIEDFKNGDLKVLINYGVLTTGFDAPKLKTLIIARQTDSIILYSQMIGRALRGPLNGGNEKNQIIDLIDNILNLGNPDFLFTYWEEFWGKKN
jgi:DNA repair protein RadD